MSCFGLWKRLKTPTSATTVAAEMRPAAQQQLLQPMARAQLVLLRRLARPHQVPQRLVRLIRHPDSCEITGPIATRQLQRVSPVRLDPVAGFHRHQRRRHHIAVHAELRQLPAS